MPTKKKTKSSSAQQIQYDPQGLAGYHSSINALLPYLGDPFTNTYTQLRIGMGERAMSGFYQRMLHNILQNQLGLGLGGGANSAVTSAQMARASRARSSGSAQNVIENVLFGERARMQAAGMLMNPLQTGQTSQSQSVEKTSGLGTWLPQVIGAGVGLATMGLGGGLGAGMGFLGSNASIVPRIPGGSTIGSPQMPIPPTFGDPTAGYIPGMNPMFPGFNAVPYVPFGGTIR